MNIKFGYYPILDMMLALRQLHTFERFKPFNSVMTSISTRISETELSIINQIGDASRDWLHVLERAIELTVKGVVSPEEFLLNTLKQPDIYFDEPIAESQMNKAAEAVKQLWQSYFSVETARNGKGLFDKVMELSENINRKGLYDYLLELTDRLIKVDEKTLKVLIKPEHYIEFDKLQNVIIMPSVFASRKFTFWNNGNDHLFFISLDAQNQPLDEPSDMLLLKTLALNDKTRLKLLRQLMSGNYSTADMADRFSMNSSTISRHFKLFKDAGFIDIFSQEGNSVYYSINLEEIKKSMDMIIDYIKGDS